MLDFIMEFNVTRIEFIDFSDSWNVYYMYLNI